MFSAIEVFFYKLIILKLKTIDRSFKLRLYYTITQHQNIEGLVRTKFSDVKKKNQKNCLLCRF